MCNESSGCRLSTESSVCVACFRHSTFGRWYRNDLMWTQTTSMTTSTWKSTDIMTYIFNDFLQIWSWCLQKTLSHRNPYPVCGDECSQDTGPARGSRPSPTSFQESRRSFCTECRSCTPTPKHHTAASLSGHTWVLIANKVHWLSIMCDAILYILCNIYHFKKCYKMNDNTSGTKQRH